MASNSATLVPTQQSVKAYVDTQLTAEDLDITTDSGTIDIDLDSETLTIAGGTGLSSSASSSTVTMAIDAAQTGITSVVNSSLELGRDADNRIKFGTDNQIIFEVDGGDNVIFKASGEIEATSLDISGDADIDGTLEADAITVNGTALNTVIAGVTVANATTAAVATTVTISDNESTNEDNAIVFTSGGDVDGGNIGLESDGDLTYNPSTGRLTATQLSGTIQTAAQSNITSLGTLTTLTVDNVIINGSTIGHTGDTDLMTVASGVLTVAGEVDATSLDISGDADIDGTLEADAITVNGTALNTVIANEATALAIALG
jgi:cytoskeletal protein CcmA (bactofilin family)